MTCGSRGDVAATAKPRGLEGPQQAAKASRAGALREQPHYPSDAIHSRWLPASLRIHLWILDVVADGLLRTASGCPRRAEHADPGQQVLGLLKDLHGSGHVALAAACKGLDHQVLQVLRQLREQPLGRLPALPLHLLEA